jgi:hypothetical protein
MEPVQGFSLNRRSIPGPETKGPVTVTYNELNEVAMYIYSISVMYDPNNVTVTRFIQAEYPPQNAVTYISNCIHSNDIHSKHDIHLEML